MRNLLILLLLTLTVGCSNPIKKSVFEPLTMNELVKIISKDSTFQESYKQIETIRDSVLTSEIERVKFADLNYKRIQELQEFYYNFYLDTVKFKAEYEKIEQNWKSKFGNCEQKADSIIDYWAKYKNENSINNYVKIELVDIDKEYYSYSNDIKQVNLGFKFTPLKGKVDQLIFKYIIKAKINEFDTNDIYSILDWNRCRLSQPITKQFTGYYEADYDDEKILKGHSISTFNRDYNIFIELDDIRINDKNFSDDNLGIPESITDYWRYGEDFMKSYYKEKIISEFVDNNYISNYEYFDNEVNKLIRSKDELAFDFIQLYYKK